MNPQDPEPEQPQPSTETAIEPYKPRPMMEVLSLLSQDPELSKAYARDVVAQEVARAAFDQDWRLAKVFSMSGVFADIKGNSETQSISTAMAKIQLGRSWNLTPADAMQFIYFTNGRPAVMNELFASKLRDAGYDWDTEFEYEPVAGGKRGKCIGCTLWMKRFDPKTQNHEPMTTYYRDGATGERKQEPLSVSFGKADSDNALIWEKGKQIKLSEKWNYQSWPEDMYFWRALGRFRRRYATNVLSGVLSREEAEEIGGPASAKPERISATVTVDRFTKSEEPNRGHDKVAPEKKANVSAPAPETASAGSRAGEPAAAPDPLAAANAKASESAANPIDKEWQKRTSDAFFTAIGEAEFRAVLHSVTGSDDLKSVTLANHKAIWDAMGVAKRKMEGPGEPAPAGNGDLF